MRKQLIVLAVLLMMLMIASCGNKTDIGTAEETKQKVAENKESNQSLSEHEDETESKTEEKTDMTVKTETAMKFDASKVKSVVIADGNTGDRITLKKEDFEKLIQKMNSMAFESIESEEYTGWTYCIEIMHEDGDSTKITISGNERIMCATGDDIKYYKTGDDIVKLAEEYYVGQ